MSTAGGVKKNACTTGNHLLHLRHVFYIYVRFYENMSSAAFSEHKGQKHDTSSQNLNNHYFGFKVHFPEVMLVEVTIFSVLTCSSLNEIAEQMPCHQHKPILEVTRSICQLDYKIRHPMG